MTHCPHIADSQRTGRRKSETRNGRNGSGALDGRRCCPPQGKSASRVRAWRGSSVWSVGTTTAGTPVVVAGFCGRIRESSVTTEVPERGRTLVPGRTIVRNSGWRARVRVTALPVGGAPGTGRTLLLNRNGAGGRLAETDLADSRSRARRALGGGFVRNGHNTPLGTGSEGRLALDHGRVGPGVPSFRNFPVALVHDFGRRSSIPTTICTISTHLATADAIVA